MICNWISIDPELFPNPWWLEALLQTGMLLLALAACWVAHRLVEWATNSNLAASGIGFVCGVAILFIGLHIGILPAWMFAMALLLIAYAAFWD